MPQSDKKGVDYLALYREAFNAVLPGHPNDPPTEPVVQVMALREFANRVLALSAERLSDEQIERVWPTPVATTSSERSHVAERQDRIDNLEGVLGELVHLKSIKERIEWLEDITRRPAAMHPDEVEEAKRLRDEYNQRKGQAWADAREAVKGTPKSATSPSNSDKLRSVADAIESRFWKDARQLRDLAVVLDA